MRKIRILLADDHETVREGLKAILATQPDLEVVGEAADGETAVKRAKALHPDIVVMDVSMPVLNGLKATEAIRQSCPQTQVLVLTRHADEAYLQQLLRAGASRYVLKQSRAGELLGAVRALASGTKYLDPAVTPKGIDSFSRRSGAPGLPGSEPALSAREEEVLRLVAWGHSNKEIAARLELSVKTVETHRANAAQKLGLRNRMDVVRLALLRGWLQDA
jgi:DNA-binding NarL/FixJ family response regulator